MATKTTAAKPANKGGGKTQDGRGHSKEIRTPEQEAADRQRARRRKQAQAGKSDTHNDPNLNRGLKAVAAREAMQKKDLVDKRRDQVAAALSMIHTFVPEEGPARAAFIAVLDEFLTAQAKYVDGVRISTTQVAINKAKAKNTKLFYGLKANADLGIKAVKRAIYLAGIPAKSVAPAMTAVTTAKPGPHMMKARVA